MWGSAECTGSQRRQGASKITAEIANGLSKLATQLFRFSLQLQRNTHTPVSTGVFSCTLEIRCFCPFGMELTVLSRHEVPRKI